MKLSKENKVDIVLSIGESFTVPDGKFMKINFSVQNTGIDNGRVLLDNDDTIVDLSQANAGDGGSVDVEMTLHENRELKYTQGGEEIYVNGWEFEYNSD